MKLRSTVAALVLALCAAPTAQAVQIVYTTTLSGSNEVPANDSPATGNAAVVYDSLAHTLTVSYSFADLMTGLADGHIHCCAPVGSNVGIAVGFTGLPLGATSGGDDGEVYDLTSPGTFSQTFIDDFAGGNPANAEATLVAGLNAGLAYFNLHTEGIPSGEIRGQLAAPIPEPGSYVLMLAGLGVLALVVRRTKRGGS